MTIAYLHGDALANLSALPDGVFQLCVTSPPYFGLRSYLPEDHDDKILEIGSERELQGYVDSLVVVFREVRRTLRDDGLLFLNLGDSYANSGNGGGNKNDSNVGSLGAKPRKPPSGFKNKDLLLVPHRVALALQADGWWLRSAIVWRKGSVMPESIKDRPTSCYEMVFMLAKSEDYFYDSFAIEEPAVSTHSSGNGFKRPARESYTNADGTPRGNDAQWTGVGGKRNARNV